MFMDIPLLATMLQFTDANWNYYTEPQVSEYITNQSKKETIENLKYIDANSLIRLSAATILQYQLNRQRACDKDLYKNHYATQAH